ncbi:MAG: flagellar hook-length control protein FliK, partial [Pseudomonadota bacterium]
ELNAGGQGEPSSTQPSPPNQYNTAGVLDRPQAATGWSLTGQVVQERAAGGIADQPPEPPTPAQSAPAQPVLEGSEIAPVTVQTTRAEAGPVLGPLVQMAAAPMRLPGSGGPAAVQITVFGSEAGAGDAKVDQAQPAAVGTARRTDSAASRTLAADVAATRAVPALAEGRRDDAAAPADSAADRRTDGLATPPVLSSLAPSPASTGARAIIDTVAAAIPMAAAGPDRVEVILSPEELGRVQMDFRADGDNVRVFLTAERPDTLDLLRRHADQLAAELRQAGYSGASLSFGQWGQSHPEGQRTGALAQVPQGEGRAQGPASVFIAGSVPGRGLDLRI